MIVDIIIIALIVLGGFIGYRKGLVGIVVSLAGLIISLILAFCLQIPVANYISSTSIGVELRTSIKEGITEALDTKVEGENNKSNVFYDAIVDKIENKDNIDNISNSVTMFILKGISFVLVFIVVFITSYIINMVLNLVFDLPILKKVNTIGGIGAGILKALLKIWIVLAIIMFLSPMPIFAPISQYILNTNIAKILYENNLIVAIIASSLKN